MHKGKMVFIHHETHNEWMHDWSHEEVMFVGEVIPSDEQIRSHWEKKANDRDGESTEVSIKMVAMNEIIKDDVKFIDVANGRIGRVEDSGIIEWVNSTNWND